MKPSASPLRGAPLAFSWSDWHHPAPWYSVLALEFAGSRELMTRFILNNSFPSCVPRSCVLRETLVGLSWHFQTQENVNISPLLFSVRWRACVWLKMCLKRVWPWLGPLDQACGLKPSINGIKINKTKQWNASFSLQCTPLKVWVCSSTWLLVN